jgi:CDP-diacylglycerol---serine O-phosphatidyltransferase
MHQLPNLITLLNLCFGCCALVCTLYFQPGIAALFLAGAFACDYADGMVARAIGATSPMGKELDSLADVVSFGVVPGALLYVLLSRAMCGEFTLTISEILLDNGLIVENPTGRRNPDGLCFAALPAFLLSACAAFRLAKFNLDTRQAHYFRGLSTPACALFVAGLALAVHDNQFGLGNLLLVEQPWIIYLLIGALSALMVSDIPMFGMKIRSLGWKDNEALILLLLFGALSAYFLKFLTLPVLVAAYIAASVLLKKNILE